MRINLKTLVIFAFGFFLVACTKPVPSSKMAFAGVWKAENVILIITKEGKVSYKRKDGNVEMKHITGSISEFSNTGFTVGIGFFATEFAVNMKPINLDGHWLMTIDGITLTRSNDPAKII